MFEHLYRLFYWIFEKSRTNHDYSCW